MGFIADSPAKRPRNKRALASVRVSDGSTPRFLQGPFEFAGNGLDKPSLIDESLRYVVPAGAVTNRTVCAVVATNDNCPAGSFTASIPFSSIQRFLPSSMTRRCIRNFIGA